MIPQILLQEINILITEIKKLKNLQSIIIENISISFTLPKNFDIEQLPKRKGVLFSKNNNTFSIIINIEEV
ncbi:hypothetical protein [Tenacibaculum aestuarii]|uniref:hypothetical protein n=1 Tax=Tenacibaculum aestuarii TaxID=362781 RepID=UPI0038B659A0